MVENTKNEVIICCTTYNHKNTIAKALEGFLMQQTSFKYVVYVHDDASTDGTQDILRAFQEKYPDKLVVDYETENQYSKGVAPLAKVFLGLDKYKYIAFCEGDDYWIYPHKLQKQYDILEADKELALCVHNGIINDNRKHLKEIANNYLQEGVLSDNQYICFDDGPLLTSSFFLRSEYYTRMPRYLRDAPLGDDPIIYYCGQKGKIYYFDGVWTVYTYQSGDSAWSVRIENDERYLQEYLKGYMSFLEGYDKNTQCIHSNCIRIQRLAVNNHGIGTLLRKRGNSVGELFKIIDGYKEYFDHKYDCDYDIIASYLLHECDDFLEYISSLTNQGYNIFVYGAGEIARSILFDIRSVNIEITGVVVSDVTHENSILGYKILSLDDAISDSRNKYVMGISIRNICQVVDKLKELGKENLICCG